jgi:acyl-CoA thioester hydrolase
MTHRLPIRVYYEDTDMAGIVYYANYLKFIERGRTEFVRELGVDQRQLKEEEGIVFAVRHVDADYLGSAKFDDILSVETTIETITGVRLVFRQYVRRDGDLLFTALVTIVAINEAGAPARLPANIRRKLH